MLCSLCLSHLSHSPNSTQNISAFSFVINHTSNEPGTSNELFFLFCSVLLFNSLFGCFTRHVDALIYRSSRSSLHAVYSSRRMPSAYCHHATIAQYLHSSLSFCCNLLNLCDSPRLVKTYSCTQVGLGTHVAGLDYCSI